MLWENDSCNKPRKHYCDDHDQVLCNGCFTALHVRCKGNNIPDQKDIRECLDVVMIILSSTFKSSEQLNAGSYIKELDHEFKNFREKLSKIEAKVKIFLGKPN